MSATREAGPRPDVRSQIVSLPWYDLRSSHGDIDRFWLALRGDLLSAGLRDLPGALQRSMPVADQWAHPNLLLSQCCGLDLFAPHARHLVPIARPVLSNLDCEPGNYYSYLIRRPGAPLVRPRLIVNSPSSYSGCTVLVRWIGEQGIEPGPIVFTGSHAMSVEAVRAGEGDLAAIDAHTFALLAPNGVEVIGRSQEGLTPPYVRRRGAAIPASDIITGALEAAALIAGGAIGVGGVIATALEDYRPMAREGLGAGANIGSPIAIDPNRA